MELTKHLFLLVMAIIGHIYFNKKAFDFEGFFYAIFLIKSYIGHREQRLDSLFIYFSQQLDLQLSEMFNFLISFFFSFFLSFFSSDFSFLPKT